MFSFIIGVLFICSSVSSSGLSFPSQFTTSMVKYGQNLTLRVAGHDGARLDIMGSFGGGATLGLAVCQPATKSLQYFALDYVEDNGNPSPSSWSSCQMKTFEGGCDVALQSLLAGRVKNVFAVSSFMFDHLAMYRSTGHNNQWKYVFPPSNPFCPHNNSLTFTVATAAAAPSTSRAAAGGQLFPTQFQKTIYSKPAFGACQPSNSEYTFKQTKIGAPDPQFLSHFAAKIPTNKCTPLPDEE